ncbi:class C sortase [Eubacterium ramulus]|uniref:class C sortase n=1 Tax=Eubacterium ramulus TaxID=39490 RepID=UPI0022E107A0|nr:class C sortase [Eubacterium ramulus]
MPKISDKARKGIAVAIIAGGLSATAYPWVSNFLYEKAAVSTIKTYENTVEELDETDTEELFQQAEEYNEALRRSKVAVTDPFSPVMAYDIKPSYETVLNLNDSGLMGYIEIPVINVYLPIYHGTDGATLQNGIGHLQGSSLPIGGSGTHSVLSGHTGLNSSKMFTDLENMKEGDLFFIHIVDRTLAYKVVEIDIVEPEDTSLLGVQNDKDLCTLVTCTPYGVNDHRLLVTGERTDYTEEVHDQAVDDADKNKTDSQWMESYKKALIYGISGVAVIAFIIFIISAIKTRRNRKEKNLSDYIPKGITSRKGL